MKRIISIIMIIGILFAVLPQSAQPGESQSKDTSGKGLMNSPWPMYRHDMRHTGRSPYGKMGCTGILKWKIEIGVLVESSPVIDKDGIIYVGGGAFCKLYAIYPDGKIKWSIELSDWVNVAPALAEDGTIYVCTERDAKLYAIERDGNIKWNLKVGRGEIYGSPLLDENGIIYVGTTKNFVAVSSDGIIKWEVNVGTASPPAKYKNTVYVAGRDGYLYALYANNGTIKWKVHAGCHRITTGVSIDDNGIIYFSSDDGYIYAFYPNGTLKWKHEMGFLCTSPAIAKNGTLYVAPSIGDENNYFVYAFDPNGTILWKCKIFMYNSNAIAIDKYGMLYGGGGYRTLYAVTPGGKMKWFYRLDFSFPTFPIASSPAIGDDGTIYVVAWDGYLYAIEPKNAADLRISAMYLGLTRGCIKIKVKNVGCEPAYNVMCKAIISYHSWMYLWDRWGLIIANTTVPEIEVGKEVEVDIGYIYLKMFHFNPFWITSSNCELLEIYVKAENANHDVLYEAICYSIPIDIIFNFVWVGGLKYWWKHGDVGWVEIEY